MDSFTLNKVAGAVLMVLLLTMGVGIVSDIIFATHSPEKPGYVIEVASTGDGAPAAAEAPQIEPIGVRLASASVDSGKKVAKKCAACHSFDAAAANKVGPALWNIVGRKPGGFAGFGYSSAMTAFGDEKPEWTYEELDAFLANPKKYLPGTSMGFAGLKKPKDRADMIAYLRESADTPQPLPSN